ncbi:MAG: TatD family hydrolase [Candidatus Ranarchaeia archaeon]
MVEEYKPWDCHCHLELPHFKKDLKEVVERTKLDMEHVVISPIDFKSYNETIKILEEYPDFIFASIGYTPPKTRDVKIEQIIKEIKLCLKNSNVKSIGEIGLDYYWVKEKEGQSFQREIFRGLIDFALEIKYPIVIHSREAEEDCYSILSELDAKKVYFHCYNGNIPLGKEIIEKKEWYVGIPANVCWRKKTQQLVSEIPIEKIFLETDSPYLHPIPGFKKPRRRNEPLNIVKYSIDKISEIKEIPKEKVVEITTKSARNFFKT